MSGRSRCKESGRSRCKEGVGVRGQEGVGVRGQEGGGVRGQENYIIINNIKIIYILKPYPTQLCSVFDCFPIYYLLIIAIPDSALQ